MKGGWVLGSRGSVSQCVNGGKMVRISLIMGEGF